MRKQVQICTTHSSELKNAGERTLLRMCHLTCFLVLYTKGLLIGRMIRTYTCLQAGHTALTVRGGSLLSTNWMFASDRPIVAAILAPESHVDAAQTAWWPLLETLVTSINNGSLVRSSLQALCPLWDALETVSKKQNKPSSFPWKEPRKVIRSFEGMGGAVSR